jgi:hypothetical protein
VFEGLRFNACRSRCRVIYASTMWAEKDWRCSTKSLVVDGVPSNMHLIPVYRAAHVTGKVLDRKVRLGRDA